MDYSKHLAISYYKTIAVINEAHKVYLVQHQESKKIFIKKVLDVYNLDIYSMLNRTHISGVPQIIDYMEEDGHLTVIEEFVSGTSLEDIMKQASTKNSSNQPSNTLSITDIAIYMRDLCEILEKLHSMNPAIIHRDIKPSNIIITQYHRAVLLDFNAAKYYSDQSKKDTVLLGTHGYAAPEQYGFGASSPQTDIYALGVVLKEMASLLPDQCTLYAPIVDKCTQINPKERYATVTELKNAIVNLVTPNATQFDSSTLAQSAFHLDTIHKVSNVQMQDQIYNQSFRRFLPPGFRTLTPWKIIVAIPVYLFLFWLCLSMDVQNASGVELWIDRVFSLTIFLSVIFVCFNYLDIQRILPLCKFQNRLVRYLGVFLLANIFVWGLFIILLVISMVCFHI